MADNNEQVTSEILKGIEEINSEEFKAVRQLLLFSTDYVEFRGQYMDSALVNNYLSVRQLLRDMPEEMSLRMNDLGHYSVTRNWILEQVINIINDSGYECPKEFLNIGLY